MAHGKPVVAFRNSGVQEWLKDQVTGIAVPFGERETFIQQVSHLLNDWKRLQEMGNAAKQEWEAQFQPVHHLDRLRAYYQSVAAS
jgi:glycosyltransferase involved in cell wall biosynthesis